MRKIKAKAKKPPWLIILSFVVIPVFLFSAYAIWSPGTIVTSGEHDLENNSIWIQHGWLGDDGWFNRNNRHDASHFRDVEEIRELFRVLSRHHMRDLFPHLCPCSPAGDIPGVDYDQTELFLDEMPGCRVMPWVGGVLGKHAFPESRKWMDNFISSIEDLFKEHPRLAGIHVNIEPMPSGNEDFLKLLGEIRVSLPEGKILSVAAYPPPTILHPFSRVHWEEAYFRKVAGLADQVAVMMYDTALKHEKLYQWLMASWTKEVIMWSEDTKVLLGLPVYDDAGVGYHDPRVENLKNSLSGIHTGLNSFKKIPRNYQGISIYSEWEMDIEEWDILEHYFTMK